MGIYVGLDNTYNMTNTPLIFVVGVPRTITSNNHYYLTKQGNSDFTINDYNNRLAPISDNIYSTAQDGSYAIQVILPSQPQTTPVIYNFTVFKQFFNINSDIIYRIINRQLPSIYQSSNELNNIDNSASSKVITSLYDYQYGLYWNALTSIGLGNNYNRDLEQTYIGINNFLLNTAYPSQFLNTLLNTVTQTSVRRYSLATTISRLVFQYLGEQVGQDSQHPENVGIPVQIVVTPDTIPIWNIIIYTDRLGDVWILGDNPPPPTQSRSLLGVTTRLSSIDDSQVLFFINDYVSRQLPAQLRFRVTFLPYSFFQNSFNTAEVGANDFYDSNYAYTYDAFMVINNNKEFSTKGFYEV